MKTEIITIGDEILIGQIVDTNSAWMAEKLDEKGFSVVQITSVPDKKDAIKRALDLALNNADIVLITGGIGPTKDDITKKTLCEFFDTELVFDEKVYRHLEVYVARLGFEMNELTRSQAYIPKSAEIILNEVGTAPITCFKRGKKLLVSMPGVPEEMKWAMEREILPRLEQGYKAAMLIHKHFVVYGIPESALALKLSEWESALPDYMSLAYLPAGGIVRLRLNVEFQEGSSLHEMDRVIKELREILGTAILAEEDISIEVLIGRLLKEKGFTLSTAESCTGGNIARLITSIAGSSQYFKGGVVSYDNSVKEEILGVSYEDLADFGAVSIPVVEQMAKGALKCFDTDIAVATSGIAGPDGGTDEKPVGTICIAVATKEGVTSRQFMFGKTRERNIARATLAALVMVRDVIV
jgi:nicotinamide-nucleotide amidase